MRNKQLIAFALGAALFVYLIYETGVASLAEKLKLIGTKIVFIIGIELIVDFFNTVGWWLTFAPDLRRGIFGFLYLLRLAGSALNQVLRPPASMGGEPAKVMLLRQHLPVTAATASVLTSRVAFTFAKAIFIAVGMLITWHRLKLPNGLSSALPDRIYPYDVRFDRLPDAPALRICASDRALRTRHRTSREMDHRNRSCLQLPRSLCSELLSNPPRLPGASRSLRISSHSRSACCRCRCCSDGSTCRMIGRRASRLRHSQPWSASSSSSCPGHSAYRK